MVKTKFEHMVHCMMLYLAAAKSEILKADENLCRSLDASTDSLFVGLMRFNVVFDISHIAMVSFTCGGSWVLPRRNN